MRPGDAGDEDNQRECQKMYGVSLTGGWALRSIPLLFFSEAIAAFLPCHPPAPVFSWLDDLHCHSRSMPMRTSTNVPLTQKSGGPDGDD